MNWFHSELAKASLVGDKASVKDNSEQGFRSGMAKVEKRREPGNLSIVPGASGLLPITEAKLWQNPCWLAFRLNYLALRYNVPLYGWVERRYGLSRPEFVVIYSLGLRDGTLARDISVSSGFPKNTLSRAIAKLTKAGLILRGADPKDKRSQILRLSAKGRRIFDEALPHFVDFEERMRATLSAAEQDQLAKLLAKMVLDSVNWPQAIATAPSKARLRRAAN